VDVRKFRRGSFIDHLVGGGDYRRRYVKAERLRHLEIDDKFVPPLDRQVAWLFTLKDAIDIGCCLPVRLEHLNPVGHQAAACDLSLRSLDNAMRGAQRAATLTQRLLAFSRQQPLDPKPLDVNKFIAAEVEFLQRSLGETIEVQAVGSESKEK
jgi:hypothetical protein